MVTHEYIDPSTLGHMVVQMSATRRIQILIRGTTTTWNEVIGFKVFMVMALNKRKRGKYDLTNALLTMCNTIWRIEVIMAQQIHQ